MIIPTQKSEFMALTPGKEIVVIKPYWIFENDNEDTYLAGRIVRDEDKRVKEEGEKLLKAMQKVEKSAIRTSFLKQYKETFEPAKNYRVISWRDRGKDSRAMQIPRNTAYVFIELPVPHEATAVSIYVSGLESALGLD